MNLQSFLLLAVHAYPITCEKHAENRAELTKRKAANW
jgi:hypothetical protein